MFSLEGNFCFFQNHNKRNFFIFQGLIANITELQLPPSKLIMGLSSTAFSWPPSVDPATLLGPLTDQICSELIQWKPKITEQDEVFWRHPNKSWTFLMRMGRPVEDEVTELQQQGISGVVLHDVRFGPEADPTCSQHRSLFIQAV